MAIFKKASAQRLKRLQVRKVDTKAAAPLAVIVKLSLAAQRAQLKAAAIKKKGARGRSQSPKGKGKASGKRGNGFKGARNGKGETFPKGTETRFVLDPVRPKPGSS